ncbi:hypothetical protein N657DRAFT_631592 [Parathielavia appendiculata]|uniref:Uncharacterized protein n=1 Tax=Parathielavia appendiculata TaxID=2587402 RepID=A0AAN6U7G3_9PEZI|nr:hypothetical protein N657DRAFT_631592 [Parathielavia appendiculata]
MLFLDDSFDIFEWNPYFQSCVRYFLDHAQYNGAIQALAAYINIQLPFQRAHHTAQPLRLVPTVPGGPHCLSPAAATANPFGPPPPHPHPYQQQHQASYHHHTAPQPYIRRLRGVRPLHAYERRNYLSAAKRGSWLEVKGAYDVPGDDETMPFLRPLRNVSEEEIVRAKRGWHEWLAMQNCMLGPRTVEVKGMAGAPQELRRRGGVGRADGGVIVKQEED